MPPFREAFFPGKREITGQQHEDPYCKFNNQLLALYVTSIFLGGLPGCLGSTFVTRKYRHRVSIFLGALFAAAGAVLEISARNTAMLLVGRFVQGFGFGFLNQAVSPYLAELAPADRRGALVCAVQVLAKAGALLTNILNLLLIKYGKELGNHGWKLSLSVIPFMLAASLTYASICVLPDTPQRPKKDDKGEGASVETTFTGSLKLLWEKKYMPMVLTGIFMPIFTQLTGVNMIGPIMFKAVGFSPVDAILIEITSSFFSGVSTSGVMYYVDKEQRMVFLIFGGVLMFVSLILLGAMEATGLRGGSAQYFPLIAMIVVYAIGFGASWGPLGVLIPSKIYPSEIRSVGVGISVTMSFTLSALIGYFYLPLLCSLRYGIFFVLAAAVFVVTASVPLFLPESGGIPLEKMQQVWRRHWFWKKFMHEENDQELANTRRQSDGTSKPLVPSPLYQSSNGQKDPELGNMQDACSLSHDTTDSPPLSQSDNGQDGVDLKFGNMPNAGSLSDDTMDPPPLSQSNNGQNDAELELGNMPVAGSLSDDTMDSPPLSQSNNGQNGAELELELGSMPDASSLSNDTMDSSRLSQSDNGQTDTELERGNMPDAGSLSDDTMDSPPLSQSDNGQNDTELDLGNMPDDGSLSDDTMDSPPLSQSNNGHDHIGDQPHSEDNP